MYNSTFVYLKNFVLLYFWIPDSGFRFQILDSGFRFWIPVLDSGSRFRFPESGFWIPAFRVALPSPLALVFHIIPVNNFLSLSSK